MNSTSTHKKLLVSAYACNPDLGSEPGMGWKWVYHLAEFYDIWLITEGERDAPAVRECIINSHPELLDKIHVTGIKRQRYGEKLWSHLYYWTYMQWQKQAYMAACTLHSEIKFDLVHQLNMIGYREPGYLWKLGLPMIWGPVGGHVQMPLKYVQWLGKNGIYFLIRNTINALQMRLSPRVHKAMKRANILISATIDDQKAISRLHHRDSTLINATCTTPSTEPRVRKRHPDQPLRLAWCGLLIPRKAMPLGLHVLAMLPDNTSIELHIMGSGQCEKEWKQLAKDLSVDKLCIWHGHLPLAEVKSVLNECDALLFTSIQDASPTVVMEAIENAIPVICHDASGHGTVIDESCGLKIPMVSPEASIDGFKQAISRLYDEKDLLQQLSEGAIKRAHELSWNKMTEKMVELGMDILDPD